MHLCESHFGQEKCFDLKKKNHNEKLFHFKKKNQNDVCCGQELEFDSNFIYIFKFQIIPYEKENIIHIFNKIVLKKNYLENGREKKCCLQCDST